MMFRYLTEFLDSKTKVDLYYIFPHLIYALII